MRATASDTTVRAVPDALDGAINGEMVNTAGETLGTAVETGDRGAQVIHNKLLWLQNHELTREIGTCGRRNAYRGRGRNERKRSLGRGSWSSRRRSGRGTSGA